ncbi:16S rRNA (cytidine(1402)-2'-O)-methyltransferase [Cyclobacterium xiamenense]|uniref:16S rRNA (cytidine(1402)-2'-O)-methyltransferase n=1 Tax=Cyclobacterium xiamenense TaxID=1297121 RepID=UPI0012B8BE56|nr:16S rRNA (cytidine(1402)-2'-O)-methyltransferase [Cyclobacterium xiamenense]
MAESASTSLFLVPTPIGNLKDITLRALETLQEVDVILAEDTRTSGKLLKHHAVRRPLESYHIHNEHQSISRILKRMGEGMVFALITDAGTPGISDPGFLLVREAIGAGFEVCSLPGATAIIPALVNSGLPNDRFVFEGFLPHKKGRNTRLQSLKDETRTMVFYESPHRLLKTLQQLSETFGPERQACVSREMTKMHEENIRGSLMEILDYYNEHTLKGEIVITVSGK